MAREVYQILGRRPEQQDPQQEGQLQNLNRMVSQLAGGPELAPSLAKGIGRGALEAGRAVLDFPSSVASLGTQAVGALSNALVAPEYNEPIQKGLQTVRENIPFPGAYIQEQIQEAAPYLKPETRAQKAFDEIIGTTTSLFLPGGLTKAGNLIQTAGNVARAAGIAVGGQAAKEIAKTLGSSEGFANNIKMGVMLPLQIFGTKAQAQGIAQKVYGVADESIVDQVYSPKNLVKQTKALSKNIGTGVHPDKVFIKEISDSISKAAKGNKVPVKKIWDLKKEVNKHLERYDTPYQARPELLKLNGLLNQSLEEYGKASNPTFLANYKMGDQIHGALRTNIIMDKLLEKFPAAGSAIKNPITKTLLWGSPKAVAGGISSALGHSPLGIAAAGTTLGAFETYKLVNRLMSSPVIRTLYKNAINSGLKQNLKAFVNDAGKLDRKIQQETEEIQGKQKDVYQILGKK